MPENCEFVNYQNAWQIDSMMRKKIKIVIWADSVGCTGCKLQLDTWKYVIEDFDNLFSNDVGYLFYLQFKEKEDLEFYLGVYQDDELEFEEEMDDNQKDEFDIRFPLPVRWDPNGLFGKSNSIDGYQCFIIDSDNKILYKGNPPFTPKERDNYIKVIEDYFNETKL